MIANHANSALLEELAGHSKKIKARKSGSYSKDSGKEFKSQIPRNNGSGTASIEEKMLNFTGLDEEEIKAAVEAGLICNEQSWNWLPSNMDCLREGLQDITNGNCQGPFTDIDELVASLKT